MPAKLERCVRKVKARNRKGKRVNPWAVCASSTGLKPHRKQKKRKWGD